MVLSAKNEHGSYHSHIAGWEILQLAISPEHKKSAEMP